MYHLEQHNLGYIAHPKTASSAMSRALLGMDAVIGYNHHSVDEEQCRLILDSGGIIMATIRNPYDLLVSWYFHYKQRRGTKAPDMESFKTWLPQQLAHPNEYIRKGLFYGLPWVNRVIRFEKLQDDFNAVLEEIGLEPITIGQFNVSRFREGQSYQEMYDSELIGLVVSHFGEVLAEHGYSY